VDVHIHQVRALHPLGKFLELHDPDIEAGVQGDKGEGWAAGTRFLLGGNGVLNSTSFLQMLEELQAHEKFQ